MLYLENCPHCKDEIAFYVSAYMDSGDICYDIEIDDLNEDDEDIESNIKEDENGDYVCKHCGKKLVIYASSSISVEKD